MTVAAVQPQSGAFANGDLIPPEHTCDGGDRSPPLAWGDLPAGTQRLALLMYDRDAPGGDFAHWLLFDLPPEPRGLAAGVPADGELPSGARQGRNDLGRLGYGGPCPPPGRAHRYVLELFALNAPLGLRGGATREAVEAAMCGHVLGQVVLTGGYSRRSR
jgi:Raf kinase inhibitor-like YbhB/YbcL family protein